MSNTRCFYVNQFDIMKYAWGELSFTSERKCWTILKNQVNEIFWFKKQDSRSEILGPSFSDERSGMANETQIR